MKIYIPKTQSPITGKVYADRLIEFLRKNNYPKFCNQKLIFDGLQDYALCSELVFQEDDAILSCMREGIIDKGEELYKFDGGMLLTFNSNCRSCAVGVEYYIFVDNHFYFMDHL